MNFKTLAAALLTMTVAGSAQATMVAGWSFNTYILDGSLQTLSGTTNTLDAQFSDFDPTGGVGAESAAFGTAFFDGSFGSSTVNPAGFPADFAPSNVLAGNLLSNNTAPVNGTPAGDVSFNGGDGFLQAELGFASPFAMIAVNAVTVVFQADLSSISDVGSNWGFSIAGRTQSGVGTIGVEFSTNGTDFTGFGTLNLTATDTPFSVVLGTEESDFGYVRLSLSQSAFIDNLAITADVGPASVPEPATAMLAISGLVGLGLMGRKRA